MTPVKKLLLPLLFLTLCAFPASAQQRIAMVDLRKVFDDYYKTKAADATLKERASELEKQKKSMVEDYRKLADEYKTAMEDANNQAISADEREKRKKAAEGKLIEVKEMEQSITQFDRQAMATLEEQEQRMRTKLLEEIQIVIDNKAKAGNFTLVLDKAGETRNRTPFVLFFNGQDDITALILKDLNANAPAGYLPTDSSKDK